MLYLDRKLCANAETSLVERIPLIQDQIAKAERFLALDLRDDSYDGRWMPIALRRKNPHTNRELGWHGLLPSAKLSVASETDAIRRHNVDKSGAQKTVRGAAKKAGITNTVTPHTLHHSFATHLLASDADIQTAQDPLGHADPGTTLLCIVIFLIV